MYRYPGLTPKLSPDIWRRVSSAANLLETRLRGLDLSALPLSDYNRGYLRNHHLPSLRSTLQKYSFILANALATSPKPVDESVVVDYGGGAGLMAMLAELCGVRAVIYSDIYDVSARDARALGAAVNAEAEHYVTGDLAALRDFVQASGIAPDVVVSYDVIEHVYDIEEFFRELPTLNPAGLSVFMASGANSANPAIQRSIVRRQHVVEHVGREWHAEHKERDCTTAYSAVRADMIRNAAPSLEPAVVETLAARTRGMMRSDIEQAVQRFVDGGVLPVEPDHSSNTCDPFTGNWEEHLMDPEPLADILRAAGMTARVVPGYWGEPRSALKAPMAIALNSLVTLAGPRAGLALAPYYAVWGWSR